MIKTKDFAALKRRLRTLIHDDLALAQLREDDDGNFRFRYERMDLKLVFDADDPAFLWLAHFGFHWVKQPGAEALANIDRCVNQVNYKIKAAKTVRTVEPDSDGDYGVSASISFVAEDVDSQDATTLERYLSLVKSATRLFLELLAEAVEKPEEPASARASVGLH